MGDRKNKNTMQGFNVQVSVQAANVSGSKQAGRGTTQSSSTVNMGVVQKSSSGRGNSQTANKVRMMATTQQTHTTHQNRPQQTHTTHQNRPQQSHQSSKNHAPQQHRPQQNKVAHKAPSASFQQNAPSTMSGQNISVNINLASLLAHQLQIPNNQQHNPGNQQHTGNQKQHHNPQQPAAGSNQRRPSQQNPKNTGGQAYTKSSHKVFMNVNLQNK